jgi:ADP-heptose:LPS heptosyltransferase
MPPKILIIKHGAFGDFIQCLGAFKALREKHLDAEITLLTTKPFEKLALMTGYFDAVWVDERGGIKNAFASGSVEILSILRRKWRNFENRNASVLLGTCGAEAQKNDICRPKDDKYQ